MNLSRSSHGDPRLSGRDLSWTWRWLRRRAAASENEARENARAAWLILVVALFFVVPLGGLIVSWAIGVAMTAGSGGGRLGASYAGALLALTGCPAALAFFAWRNSQRLFQALVSVAISVLFALLSLVALLILIGEVVRR